ncbi:hypothetical protein [Micromonospora rifamycinica]|uniref:hypothetical protein n=1 Tax=Micromonospora rifamycinica TaxID=291594 RepID=UPI0012F900D3|nr:hypothetical protein [Micromonospora rifamycinica]
MTRERFVVHLPVAADDLAAAQGLARAITRALASLPDVDPGTTTVSHEDDQPTTTATARPTGGGGGRAQPAPDNPPVRRPAVDGR